MLPFRRFKDDANVLDQCVTMIEDTIHDIEEYVNKAERKTESLTETLSHLMDVYNEMLDVLEDDDMTVNPRLHYRMYPRFAPIFGTHAIAASRQWNGWRSWRAFRTSWMASNVTRTAKWISTTTSKIYMFRCYSGFVCIEGESENA